MKMQEIKKKLRDRLYFRFIVITTAVICVLISYFLSGSECSVCKTVKDLLLGIAGSAFVWSIIELFDFMINIYDEYKGQRDKFIEKSRNFCSGLSDLLSDKEPKDVEYDKVCSCVSDFHQIISQTPFHEPIYAISDEFISIYNYINRLYWKLLSLNYIYKSNCGGEDSDKKQGAIYDTLVEVSTAHQEIAKYVQDANNIDNEYEKLSKIEVNSEPLTMPSNIVIFDTDGDLGSTMKINDFKLGILKRKTLKISQFFDKIDKNPPAFRIVFSLIWGKIKPYE